jgi:basic membrane protein A
MVAHTGSFSDFVRAGAVAHTQIRANADILSGASQQAIGALRAVGDVQYASRHLWWVGQDLAQFGTPEGKAKCIAASSYNYAAVIIGLVQKFDSNIRGGQCIPMNFNNGGFVFQYNPDLSNMAPANIKARVDEVLAKFKAAPNSLNYAAVDYSKL